MFGTQKFVPSITGRTLRCGDKFYFGVKRFVIEVVDDKGCPFKANPDEVQIVQLGNGKWEMSYWYEGVRYVVEGSSTGKHVEQKMGIPIEKLHEAPPSAAEMAERRRPGRIQLYNPGSERSRKKLQQQMA